MLALALCAMNLLADYSFLPAAYNCPDLAGVVGYVAYFSSAAGTCIQVLVMSRPPSPPTRATPSSDRCCDHPSSYR